MKKTLLAVAIPALLVANAASAVELYKDDASTFAVGGWLDAGVTGSEKSDADVDSISSRINIAGTQDLGNGFVAEAKAEWAVNLTEGGENTFTTRLGYLGLTHETYGHAVIGTQWAPYYDVAGVTDMPIYFANDFLYNDHYYELGTARAEKMISYRKAFDLGNAGALDLGVAWQGEQDQFDDRYQAALTYKVMNFSLGYAYNGGDVNSDNGYAQAVSATYGSYGTGFYAAGVYARNKNMDTVAKTNNYELIAAYALENSLNFVVNYENSEVNSGNIQLREEAAFQVEYNFLPNLIGYVGYQFDLDNDAALKSDDDTWAFGARYVL